MFLSVLSSNNLPFPTIKHLVYLELFSTEYFFKWLFLLNINMWIILRKGSTFTSISTENKAL